MPLPAVRDLPLPELGPAHAPFLTRPDTGSRFANPWGVSPAGSPAALIKWQTGPKPFREAKRRPPRLPVVDDPVAAWEALPPGARLQWLGHASVLIELDGVTALIDPIFGKAGPVVPRKVPAPRPPDALPPIDLVLLTHGHYDHLDRPSLRAIGKRNPEALFVVPRGQARSLPGACKRRVELGWWQAVDVPGVQGARGIQAALVPAQHWHRRGLADHDKALWGGVMLSGSRSVFHSGDTGYFGGFATIREVLGPPDVAVLPLGAFEPRWFMGPQHMAPEDSVQAFCDLGARHFVGMHWGTYDLTDEPMDHGAFTVLPRTVAERGLDPARFHVLAHGGGLGFAEPDAPVHQGRQPMAVPDA